VEPGSYSSRRRSHRLGGCAADCSAVRLRAVRRHVNLLTRAPNCESLTSSSRRSDGGVRRAEPSRAAGDRRARAQTHLETRDGLTAQTRQVALVARHCMSNIEIGARLFLSRHTRALAPRQGVLQAGDQLRRGAGYGAPELRVRAGPGLALRRMPRVGGQSRACLPWLPGVTRRTSSFRVCAAFCIRGRRQTAPPSCFA